MILSGAGIRYFSSGINTDRAYPMGVMQNKCPCWWEGPDGSRVLMMYMWGYADAEQWGLDKDFDLVRAGVLGKLQGYRGPHRLPLRRGVPPRRLLDNEAITPRLVENVRRWNGRYEYPQIIFSPNAEFFEYIEKRYDDKLPTYRGSAGTYWEDGAGSSARETALDRRAHEELSNGEKFLALADRIGGTSRYRPDEINQAWRNCILYDEHTWGAYCSIDQPESDFTKAQWKIKSQFAVDAAQEAKSILDRGARPWRRWCGATAPPWSSSTPRAGRAPTWCSSSCPRGWARPSGMSHRRRRRRARCSWSRTSRLVVIGC